MKILLRTVAFIMFGVMVGFAIGVLSVRHRAHIRKVMGWNNNRIGLPDSIGVRIDSTNLPIIFISTNGKDIERYREISCSMKIIDNGVSLNYGDTITHTGQNIDFDGLISLRYRGHTSFDFSDKKSFAIRALDKPITEGGKKKKSKLLGMRKGKKWALIALHIDKSMIRNALTYELARPIMDFVPQSRYCELFIDSVYYGIYGLTEQITADRIKLDKPTDVGNGITGGYLLEIDWKEQNGAIISERFQRNYFSIVFPDSTKLTTIQRSYLERKINKIEDALKLQNEKEIGQFIDMKSMIDYQIMTELSHNVDGYTLSTFLFKHRHDDDDHFKFVLWDYDLAYGNYAKLGCSDIDTWLYKTWWAEMMKSPRYIESFKSSWRQYRQDVLSDKRIYNTIDSLANILTVCGAEQRNSTAWSTLWSYDWTGPKRNGAQKYLSSSYKEEIEYLKEWIFKRLKWMDEQLEK